MEWRGRFPQHRGIADYPPNAVNPSIPPCCRIPGNHSISVSRATGPHMATTAHEPNHGWPRLGPPAGLQRAARPRPPAHSTRGEAWCAGCSGHHAASLRICVVVDGSDTAVPQPPHRAREPQQARRAPGRSGGVAGDRSPHRRARRRCLRRLRRLRRRARLRRRRGARCWRRGAPWSPGGRWLCCRGHCIDSRCRFRRPP